MKALINSGSQAGAHIWRFVQTQVAGCTPRVSDSVGLAGSGVGLRALCF